ncbi:MAG: riboflavin synthase, partial [Arenicellales bacterium]
MFTGIVQDIGRVVAVRPHDGDLALDVQPSTLNCESVNIGDSVAVAGVCLTVVRRSKERLTFDIS